MSNKKYKKVCSSCGREFKTNTFTQAYCPCCDNFYKKMRSKEQKEELRARTGCTTIYQLLIALRNGDIEVIKKND